MDTETGHTKGKLPCADAEGDHSYSSTSQWMPGIAGNHQNPGEARKDASLETLEGAWPCLILDFQVSRTVIVEE